MILNLQGVFGEVAEGFETLTRINEAYADGKGRLFKNIRIKHTYILEDPYDDPPQLPEFIPEGSPEGKPKDEIGDIPDYEVKPPDNVLFVWNLNPVTQDEDLHTIFPCFGTVSSAEIICDHKTGDNLCYAFIALSTAAAAAFLAL
ncbi:peptidyl-prolyl cis-trans isomerase 4-like protein [Trifolium pratense]|uniref:peptidylprolyl isomerase n=1 Tax=Trifolium pratense TaxID=57577 RepID=A0A2K3MYR7_TRIPR|nr:peptidyl-prolyl cis-trans isomerase 4-like protein [Trifolium pratense]